jgi:hypothetical protein
MNFTTFLCLPTNDTLQMNDIIYEPLLSTFVLLAIDYLSLMLSKLMYSIGVIWLSVFRFAVFLPPYTLFISSEHIESLLIKQNAFMRHLPVSYCCHYLVKFGCISDGCCWHGITVCIQGSVLLFIFLVLR